MLILPASPAQCPGIAFKLNAIDHHYIEVPEFEIDSTPSLLKRKFFRLQSRRNRLTFVQVD